jgi:DNA replication licensing factor MCM4
MTLPFTGYAQVSLYFPAEEQSRPQAPVTHAFIKDYIAYAKAHVHPELSEGNRYLPLSDNSVNKRTGAAEGLVRGYLEMRGRGGAGKTVTATPRQLESLIRLSQALARMKLSRYVCWNVLWSQLFWLFVYASVVTEDDVIEAIRLVRVATQTAATDPRTGTIDMDMINTGR